MMTTTFIEALSWLNLWHRALVDLLPDVQLRLHCSWRLEQHVRDQRADREDAGQGGHGARDPAVQGISIFKGLAFNI